MLTVQTAGHGARADGCKRAERGEWDDDADTTRAIT